MIGVLINFVEDPNDSDVTSWSPKLWSRLAGITEGDAPLERPSWDQEIDDLTKMGMEEAVNIRTPRVLKEGWFSPSARLGRNRIDHISMIPDELSYRVRDAVGRSVLGSGMTRRLFSPGRRRVRGKVAVELS